MWSKKVIIIGNSVFQLRHDCGPVLFPSGPRFLNILLCVFCLFCSFLQIHTTSGCTGSAVMTGLESRQHWVCWLAWQRAPCCARSSGCLCGTADTVAGVKTIRTILSQSLKGSREKPGSDRLLLQALISWPNVC